MVAFVSYLPSHTIYDVQGPGLIQLGGTFLVCLIVFVETGLLSASSFREILSWSPQACSPPPKRPADLESAAAGRRLRYRRRPARLLDRQAGRPSTLRPPRLLVLPPSPSGARPPVLRALWWQDGDLRPLHAHRPDVLPTRRRRRRDGLWALPRVRHSGRLFLGRRLDPGRLLPGVLRAKHRSAHHTG